MLLTFLLPLETFKQSLLLNYVTFRFRLSQRPLKFVKLLLSFCVLRVYFHYCQIVIHFQKAPRILQASLHQSLHPCCQNLKEFSFIPHCCLYCLSNSNVCFSQQKLLEYLSFLQFPLFFFDFVQLFNLLLILSNLLCFNLIENRFH